MASRRKRRSSRRSSGTDWGKVALWTLGIGAGLFVLTAGAGVAAVTSIANSNPTPTIQDAQNLLNQMRSSP